jgi:hypothetical protein
MLGFETVGTGLIYGIFEVVVGVFILNQSRFCELFGKLCGGESNTPAESDPLLNVVGQTCP